LRIKKGDIVKVISGNDKGKTGKVIKVFPGLGKIMVEGVGIRKKHVRPKRQGQKGEVVRMPAPFSVSRVMTLCPKCGKLVRLGCAINGPGQKIRVCRKCGGEI